MKKTLVIILISMLLFSVVCPVLAETEPVDFSDRDFEIRGGIRYDTRWKEIKRIETEQNGMVFNRTQKHNSRAISDNQGLFEGSIAGCKNSDMWYLFDVTLDSPLKSIKYQFNKTGKRASEIYSDMLGSLTEKYGAPNFATSGKNASPVLFADNAYSKDVTPFSEWLIKYRDCYVDIGLYVRNNEQCCIMYSFFTYEEMDSVLNGSSAEDEIMRDL